MLLMSLPGFTSGEKAQNAVVAAMYLVAIVAVVGGAAMLLGLPGSVGAGGDSMSSSDSGAIEKTQATPQPEDEVEGSGWVTSTPTGGPSSDELGSASSTQRIDGDQIQLTVFKKVLQNSSRIEPLSVETRQSEIYVRYTQDSMTQSEVRSGAGEVTGAFVGSVSTGSDLQALHGQLVNAQGQVAYTYTIDRETVVKYNNGEISKQQFRQAVLDALQPTDQASTTVGLA